MSNIVYVKASSSERSVARARKEISQILDRRKSISCDYLLSLVEKLGYIIMRNGGGHVKVFTPDKVRVTDIPHHGNGNRKSSGRFKNTLQKLLDYSGR